MHKNEKRSGKLYAHYPDLTYHRMQNNFRYRPVNLNSLEALRTNRLYFSSANYYDDPFDTFLHIDIDSIHQEFLTAC